MKCTVPFPYMYVYLESGYRLALAQFDGKLLGQMLMLLKSAISHQLLLATRRFPKVCVALF